MSWHYPSASSSDCDRYVTYNYVEGVWYGGTLSRTKWIDAASRKYPMATGDNGTGDNNYLYFHDIGYSEDGEEMTAYIETGDINIDAGQHFTRIKKIAPDLKFRGALGSASVDITIKGRRYPQADQQTLTTATVVAATEKKSVKARARQFALRFSSTTKEFGWRLGLIKLDTKPDGKK